MNKFKGKYLATLTLLSGIVLSWFFYSSVLPKDLSPKYRLSIDSFSKEQVVDALSKVALKNDLKVLIKNYPRTSGEGELVYMTMDKNNFSVLITNLESNDVFRVAIRDSLDGDECLDFCTKIKGDIQREISLLK